jgi:hypothetical protein
MKANMLIALVSFLLLISSCASTHEAMVNVSNTSAEERKKILEVVDSISFDKSREEAVLQGDNSTQNLKPESEVDASDRVIKGYKIKKDASGEIIKDENGNFIFIPIYEDHQKE